MRHLEAGAEAEVQGMGRDNRIDGFSRSKASKICKLALLDVKVDVIVERSASKFT